METQEKKSGRLSRILGMVAVLATLGAVAVFGYMQYAVSETPKALGYTPTGDSFHLAVYEPSAGEASGSGWLVSEPASLMQVGCTEDCHERTAKTYPDGSGITVIDKDTLAVQEVQPSGDSEPSILMRVYDRVKTWFAGLASDG